MLSSTRVKNLNETDPLEAAAGLPRNVEITKLKNGLTVVTDRMEHLESAALGVWVKAGSRDERTTEHGIAHLLEHMAFNGSENVPEGEMVKSLERLGLSFGADTNASTSFSRTQYMLNLPDVGDETVDYALFLMRETADKLLIEQAAVDRERGVVKAEEARGNTPGRKAQRAFSEFMYPGMLSTKRPVIGLPETLDTINAAQLRKFYDTYYRPERALLVMTGDMDTRLMQQKIETVFGDWENNNPDPGTPDLGRVKPREMDVSIYDDDELTTRVSFMDARESTYTGDNFNARRKNFVRSYANAIVNQRIRKQLLDTGADVRAANISYSSSELGDQLSAYAAAKDDNWRAAIELLDIEIRKALMYGFQQSEYDELLSNTRRSLTDSANYAAKRKSSSLASGIIGNFSRSYVRTTPAKQLEYFENHAATITKEDLEKSFQAMWTDFSPAIWLVGPKLEGVPRDQVIESYKDALLRTPGRPEIRQKRVFAYQDFGKPGKIMSETHIEDFDIDQIVFSNNVKLNLKKTDFEDKWINMRITVGEGWNAFPKDNPALLTLANAFPLGGYEAHKASELSEIFAAFVVLPVLTGEFK